MLYYWIFCYKQFYDTNEKLRLSDGYELNLKWQKGTGLIRRAYIRKLFSNMIPVKVNSNNEDYVLYVSKYEFSDGDLSVITNESFSSIFGCSKRATCGLSFRESQVVLEMLKALTGVKTDFLSYNEWKSIAKCNKHSSNDFEYGKVTIGNSNEDGLFNILGNVPEFTSNYYNNNYRVGMAADTIFRAYNNVVVAGSAYRSNDSINFSFVNKNFREGLVGFRVIIRPNDIGTRKFTIKGHLRSDRKYSGLPEKIELISIDGHCIENISNYESFEEILIECSTKKRTIEAIDLSLNKVISFEHPKGLSYYDLVPEFYFIGF